MSLRPLAPNWFELIIIKDDYIAAMAALAKTGQVELESNHTKVSQLWLDNTKQSVDKFLALKKQYATYWSNTINQEPIADNTFSFLKEVALSIEKLKSWETEASSLIKQLQSTETSFREILQWKTIIGRLIAESRLNPALLMQQGKVVQPAIFLFNQETELESLEDLLYFEMLLEEQKLWFAVLPIEDKEIIFQKVISLKGQILTIPKWLHGVEEDILYKLNLHLEALEAKQQLLKNRLEDIDNRHQLSHILTILEQLAWFEQNRVNLAETENLIRVTGWLIPDKAIQQNISTEVPALLHFPITPQNLIKPSILSNPPWVKPFEVFVKALGIPQQNEIDPSLLLAFIVPLMFGYMFGDVGQGLVLLTAGWLLRKKFKLNQLIIFVGLSTVFFGFLYGKFFTLHAIPALWLHPLEHPLLLMAIPLIFGFILLSLGLFLNALQVYWRYPFKYIFGVIGLLLIYYGILGAFWQISMLYLSLIGLFMVAMHQGWKHSLVSIGEGIEASIQLLLNTLSFVRIGAFALAHAGLAAAVVSMTEGVALGIAIIILILGNILIIVLEGMVVSIQTTRLILFEFFVRFFQGEGRIFKPLPLAPGLN